MIDCYHVVVVVAAVDADVVGCFFVSQLRLIVELFGIRFDFAADCCSFGCYYCCCCHVDCNHFDCCMSCAMSLRDRYSYCFVCFAVVVVDVDCFCCCNRFVDDDCCCYFGCCRTNGVVDDVCWIVDRFRIAHLCLGLANVLSTMMTFAVALRSILVDQWCPLMLMLLFAEPSLIAVAEMSLLSLCLTSLETLG